MIRRLLLPLAAAVGAGLCPHGMPTARADRLGGNYRGPGDRCDVREDPAAPPAPTAPPQRRDDDPLPSDFSGDVPFLAGVEAGRREAEFRGRPMLVFCVLRGCSACAAVADAAFRDAEVADLASRFVPVLADADREEALGIAHRVRTFPTILILDPAGAEAGRVEGRVDAARVADLLRKALKKPGLSRPTAADRDLGRASASLARARTAKDWRSLLAAASSIESIGHEGPELDDARAARREATTEAVGRLAAAKAMIAKGTKVEARQALARIAREFEGLDEAVEAKNLLREMDGPKPGGGAPGGGEGSKVDPRFDERLRHAAGDLDPGTSAERRQEPGALTPAPAPEPK